MSRAIFFATPALGLCIAVAPLTTAAQTVIIAPLVQACVGAPSVENCQQYGAVLAECADDRVYTRCELLFEEANEIFEDPAPLERVQPAADKPRKRLLVEGHTDVAGPTACNLALALSEFFDIPPDNPIIQGWGERHPCISPLPGH